MTNEDRVTVKLGKRTKVEIQSSEMLDEQGEGSNMQEMRRSSREHDRGMYHRDSPERGNSLTRKIDVPMFDRENVRSWVLRVEQYFELGDFSEEEKLKVVRMCFDGEALTWYRWERDRDPFRDWKQLKNKVLENFSAAQDLTPGEMLLALRQEGSTGEYCRDFIALASNAPEMSEVVLQMAFMTGLKAKTRAGVRMFEPKSLNKMMSFLKMVEEWNKSEFPSTGGASGGTNRILMNEDSRFMSPFRREDPVTGLGAYASRPKGPLNREAQTVQFRGKEQTLVPNYRNREIRRYPSRRLTEEEKNERRAKGHCFRCDDKFQAGHQCRLKELQVIIVQEDDTEREWEFDEEEDTGQEKLKTAEQAELAELSLNSAVGISSPRTIKLQGKLREEPVVVLIDSGASHNFVSVKLVEKLESKQKGREVME